TLPGSFVNSMAAFFLSGLAKKMLADLAQVRITNILGVPPYLFKQVIDFCHISIISIMIPKSIEGETFLCQPTPMLCGRRVSHLIGN
ncbi:MAG: hypothetical protein ACLFPI_00340, partial [Desulfobacterales bacterium]